MAIKQHVKALAGRPGFWGALAVGLFWLTRSPGLYPGESATWTVKLLGLWGAWGGVEAHPLITPLLRAVAAVVPPTWGVSALNGLTVLGAGACVWLLCHLVRRYFAYVVSEPRSQFAAAAAAKVGTAFAGLAMVVAGPVVLASGHCQWQIFDLLLLLIVVAAVERAARTAKVGAMALAAFLSGLVATEAPWLLLAAPFCLLAAALGWWCGTEKPQPKHLVRAWIVPAALGAATGLAAAIGPAVAQGGGIWVCGWAFAQMRLAGVLEYLREGWLLVLLFGVVPFALCVLMGREVGANRRSLAGLGTYLSAAVLAICALLPISVAPATLARQWHEAQPVALYAMTAFAVAFLMGASVLLIRVKVPPEAAEELRGVRWWSGLLAWGVRLGVVVALGVALEVTERESAAVRQVAALPKAMAQEILAECAGPEVWLLGDGVLDPHLAAAAAESDRQIVVFSLTQDNQPQAMAKLRQALATSPYFADKPELRERLDRALDIGMIPFMQDWIRADSGSETRFVTLALPDLWFTGDRLPLPRRLTYAGIGSREAQAQALAQQLPIAEPLAAMGPFSDEDLAALPGPMADFARYARRQVGFVANNTAFFLAAGGKTEEAYTLFREVYAWDPENVSALFNIFELVNGGLHPEMKVWCEKELNALLKKLSGRKYKLWALARTYGYIRSPQLISALAGNWAMSGQTGAALSGLDLAMEMLDDETRVGLQGAVAALYTLTPGKRQEAIARYKELLTHSTSPHKSLEYLRQLLRMTILEGNFAEAKALLEQAEAVGGQEELAYERALYLASAGDAVGSRIALETFLARYPKHADALAMLATLQMQSEEFEALRTNTLPKLITAAGTEDNYFVQIILAQLAEREGTLPKARAAYLRALALKPEVYTLRETVLAIDIRLNDKVSAEQHARKFLYQDRAMPLANYVMGSLALGEGDLKRAESYLTLATAPDAERPLPEAFNDLAETYRRLGKWAAALSAAQRAAELAPRLAVARETAAAALLELGRLGEAQSELDAAFALDAQLREGQPKDPRFLITQARIHLANQLPDLARVALAEAKKQYDSLDKGAQAEFDRTAAAAGLK
ncbi:MAG: tetratricopeptide repeat protein [Candidatus Spyradenecus sp.]